MIATRVSTHLPTMVLLLSVLLALQPASGNAADSDIVTGSGVAKSEARNVSGFHGVALEVHAKLDLRQDDSEGLMITGDDNIVPLVETVVEDGTLKIRWKKGTHSTRYKDLTIVVNTKSVDGVAIAGSGEIAAQSLKAGNLRVSLAGSGRVTFDALNADSASVSIDGSGYLIAAGRVDSLDVSVAGSGRLSAAKLESQKAKVRVAGSGHATIWATQALNASVAGSGSVRYYGKPRVNSAIAGSGMVTQAGDLPG